MIAALLAAAAVAGPAEVADLAWMAGSWSREQSGGRVVRESWLAPLDGAMGGLTQTTRPGRPPMFEFATITTEPAGVTFTAHLKGQPPTAFLLKPGSPDGEAVFENLAHDFPQRVIYRRCGADLCARIEGVQDGAIKATDWRYRRIAP